MTSSPSDGALQGAGPGSGDDVGPDEADAVAANSQTEDRPDDSRLRALGLIGDPPGDRVGDEDPTSTLHQDVGGDPGVADTPMWLSHHPPRDYERCATVAGLHVCRRCLVLYPLALVAGVVVTIGDWWDGAWDPWVLWLFPLPGVVEFVLDNLGVVSYRPKRQVTLSAMGAVAAGVGYVRYLGDFTDPLVWSVVAVYTAACLSAAVIGGVRRQRTALAEASEPTTTIGGPG